MNKKVGTMNSFKEEYKSQYKRKNHSKFLSTDPEIKRKFGIFKIPELLKFEDQLHFQNLYSFDKDNFSQYKLPVDKEICINKQKKDNVEKQMTEKQKQEKSQESEQKKKKASHKRVQSMDMASIEKDEKTREKEEKLKDREDQIHLEMIEKNYKDEIPEDDEPKQRKLKNVFRKMFDPNKKKDENEIQEEELYEKKDSKTSQRMKEITNGEQAVQFFAMYGNTTPIKFIFCKKKVFSKKYIFRPYDLTKLSPDEEASAVDYFVITPTGITHTYTITAEDEASAGTGSGTGNGESNGEGKGEGEAVEEKSKSKTIAEFYTLSDWMYQSTLFNILKRINFFREYLKFKLFIMWRNYNRFKRYLKLRNKLGDKLFLAKPAFIKPFITCNGQTQQIDKTILHDVTKQTWTSKQLLDFEDTQKKTTEKAKSEIKSYIERDIFSTLRELYHDVTNRLTKNKDIDEKENAKTLQELRNKSMYILKVEKKIRRDLIHKADKDTKLFEPFVKTIDLMIVEQLFQLNKKAIRDIKEQLYRVRTESNFAGYFTLFLNFAEANVALTPSNKDLEEKFRLLFKFMIDCLIDVPRVLLILNKKEFETYILQKENPDNDKGVTRISDFEEGFKKNLKKILENSKDFINYSNLITTKLMKDYSDSKKNIQQKFEAFKSLQEDKEMFSMKEYLERKNKLEDIKKKIDDLQGWNQKVDEVATQNVKGVINTEVSTVKEELKQFLNISKKALEEYLVELYHKIKKKILEDSSEGEKIYSNRFNNIKKTCAHKEKLQEYAEKLEKLRKRCNKFSDLFGFLKQMKIELSTTDTSDHEELAKTYETLLGKNKASLMEIERMKDGLLNSLVVDIQTNKNKIKELNDQITTGVFLDVDTPTETILNELKKIDIELKTCSGDSERYAGYQKTLDAIDQDTKGELDKLKSNFDLKSKLWKTYINFEIDVANWEGMTINNLRNADIENKMKNYLTTYLDLSQQCSDSDRVCETLSDKIRQMNTNLPIIMAFSSSSMLERHWKEIFHLIHINFVQNKTLDEITLKDLLKKHNILNYTDNVEMISAAAFAQEKISTDLVKIENDWKERKFVIQPHNKSRDKFIITTIEEINQQLDEHTQLIQSAFNSRYVSDIKEKVQAWEDDLNLITRILEEWLFCQKQWIYLENIFSAEDIKKQIPDAYKLFFKVNKGFKDLMYKSNANPNVYERCKTEGLLDMLIRFNKELDNIQKSLEDYLQTKRKAFPRFYFLSNDELLKILSQTRNPRAVQDYLNKCFDGIKSIKFASETSNEILSMISPEDEVVEMIRPVIADANIERWLGEVEEVMFASVYNECKNCISCYPEPGKPRKEWIMGNYACQAVLTIDQIQWAVDLETRFTKIENEKSENIQSIKEYYNVVLGLIIELSDMVSLKSNTAIKKGLIERLIIINVHARDVVKELIRENVQDKNNFEWSKILKFYWENSEKGPEVFVRQTNAKFIFGYEYLGNPERMVITPLTDKCYITLTSALHLKFGGAPAGPAGTGKTETTKDLGKAMAVKVNVFNCSDQLDITMMGRMFCGLAECGAWACFDEFNRIEVEVLSVIAQQVETIQAALKENAPDLIFEGKQIKLKKSFGVFITMNPGYAGRAELPDNLKSLFRPMAMMVPNYALVSEVTLFSKGFREAKELSIKMFQLFKLSSEQLSKQKHYDFGLRGIKSILTRAGYLKEKDPNEVENKVLIRAMKDSNLPKFLDADVELFLDIIGDLFPRVVVPVAENKPFLEKLKTTLDSNNLQYIPKLVEKINMLLDTMMVRLGNMIVGLTGTGKTTCYQNLAKTLTELSKDKNYAELNDPWFAQVILSILNPKSVTKSDLYMNKDEVTQTWEDGIVAKMMRNAEEDEKQDKIRKRRWIIFDGPVDALWIEDMNTVLDDSRKLCLPDGSNIKIPKYMNLIFEVNDLKVASPATVSRCGMVYLEPHHVGYIPIIDTWCINYKKKLNKIFDDDGSRKHFNERINRFLKYIDKMCELLKTQLPTIFSKLRNECKEMIPSVDVNLVQSLLNFVSCFINPEYIKLTNDNLEDLAYLYFSFSLFWSIGANIEDRSRKAFSRYLKDFVQKLGVQIDPACDVYDVFVNNETNSFMKWTDKKETFKYVANTSFFNILVPTSDTLKYKYLMNHLSKNNNNCLFIGETGVGKSVIIFDFLKSLDTQYFIYKSSNFSAKTTSKNVYDTLKASIFNNGNFQPPTGKKFMYFIDDINIPQLDSQGSQQPIEFIRQLIDLKTFYNEKKILKKIKDVNFISACCPPNGGRNPVTPRLFRHFNMIWMTELSSDSMKQIFKSILEGFLDITQKSLSEEAGNVIDSALEIYNRIRTEKLPTPAKTHYTFNLRDMSKVVQGMLQINSENLPDKPMLAKLWTHEACRQFRDRLLGEDIKWFDDTILSIYEKNFDLDKKLVIIDELIFSDIVDKNYKNVADTQALSKKINDSLDRYNMTNRFSTMNLVFFSDAINHFCRISRILSQPRGNALLVGLGGSGRASITKLVGSSPIFQLNYLTIAKGYGVELFWKDLGRILTKAGTLDSRQIFIFSDTQIIFESFLEDINNILNNGEVPNLFKEDELNLIQNTIKETVKSGEVSDNKDALYQYFVGKIRENLRLALCFSPVGSGFRNRCRQFPSIINCCTIDWFKSWPEEALVSVADRYVNTNESLAKMEGMSEKLVKIFVKIHTTALELSVRFLKEHRRNYYITPTSYLEFLKLFLDIYAEQIQIIPKQISNYKLGIEKLDLANTIVDSLKEDLIKLQPELVEKKKNIEIMIVELTEQRKKVDVERGLIQGDKDNAQLERDRIAKIAEECDRDLKEATPALEKAKEALKGLSEPDMNGLKQMPKPSAKLVALGKCICFIFDSKGNEWDDFKKIMAVPKEFIEKCQNEDLMNKKLGDPRKLNELRKIFKDIEAIDYTTVSLTAKGLKMWTESIIVYVDKFRIVKPKMENLAKAKAELEIVESSLAEKSAFLRSKEDELNKLENDYNMAEKSLSDLQKNMENIEIKLKRAGRLVGGLTEEGKRWKENIITLEKEEKKLLANVILANSTVAYSGPFITEFRNEFIYSVKSIIKDEQIYHDGSDFKIADILGDTMTIRDWNASGLPADDLSIENAIITTKSKRWPLMIDPQEYYKSMQIKSYKANDKNLLSQLNQCISSGWPCLIEDILETVDSSLTPVLAKNIFKQGAILLIQIGDKPIQYSPHFKLFITTKLPNPHYLPETSIKVTIINFTVTMKGLEDQLLVDVVKNERPDLEELIGQLVVQINSDRKVIKDIETDILNKVKDASNDILDNDILVNKLDQSKVKSTSISQKLEVSEKTAKDINKERRAYRPIAKRGSILYFVIASLANVNEMYNNSLSYFSKIFNQRLQRSEACPILDKRVQILINDITINFFHKICRGLFETDKLLYSFLITMNIALAEEEIPMAEWNIFLRGPTINPHITEKHAWLDDNQYKNLLTLKEYNSIFFGIEASFTKEDDILLWKKFMESDNPEMCPLPEKYELMSNFSKLCLVKAMREEKLIFALKLFIGKTMGKEFLESPPFSIASAFEDSLNSTPLIFILSAGANPVNFLKNFAKTRDITVNSLSLGQGQGKIAKEMIYRSRENGQWVCLENCHLSLSWMPALEEIQMDFNQAECHENYRLWLTSIPDPLFPVSILQSGVKITNEPPKGIKANLKGTFQNIKESDFEGSSKPYEFKKLLFCLAFFHAIIIERRKFGALGWNIRYEWMNSDLETSKLHLRMYIDEYNVIPFKILRFLIGEINYGGRVTDDKDVLVINAILHKYYDELVFDELNKFSDSGVYYAPAVDNLQTVTDYLETLPLDDDPEVFGLHQNANITLQSSNVKQFLEPLVAIQPRTSSSSNAKTPDEIVADYCSSLEEKMREAKPLDSSKAIRESIYEKDKDKKSSLGNFLLQETEKFNNLITIINKTLSELKLAVAGKIVMSASMEKIYASFLDSKVPLYWEDNAYLSLKPLGAWVNDFVERIKFMSSWLYEGKPCTYWLSAFFFPQGFNTSVLQEYARKKLEPIDTLTFRTNVLKLSPDNVKTGPEEGLYIHGLFIVGGSWNWVTSTMKEQDPKELSLSMPCIWLEPIKVVELRKIGNYECPLYKTSTRKGELSTTGHSTNFVMYFFLKTEEEPDHWIRRGAALLTQLDN